MLKKLPLPLPISKNITRKETVGKPPGALIHVGERVMDTTEIDLIEYSPTTFHRKDRAELSHAIDHAASAETITWLNVEGLHDTELVGELGRVFDVHPLVMEGVLNTQQRPRFDEGLNTLSLSFKALSRVEEGVQFEHTTLVLGNQFVLVFQEGKLGDVFDPIRTRLQEGVGRIRGAGPDYLFYALIDLIVDNYFLVLEDIGERIDVIEREILEEPNEEVLHELQILKRQLLAVRRAVAPFSDALRALLITPDEHIQEGTIPYLQSVSNHLMQVVETTDAYREMISGAIDIYLNSVNSRMTNIVNVLTIIMSIFIPLTFVAGVYGMNFEHMPELAWRWGYPAVWGVMILLGLGMAAYFRRQSWL